MRILALAILSGLLVQGTNVLVPPALSQTVRDTAQVDSESASVTLQDWFDKSRHRHIPIKIYAPHTGRAPYPVVTFSHGLGGSREAAQYLGEYWSAHGYICVFVQHIGSDESLWQSVRSQGREAIINAMKDGLNPQSFADRVGDIKFVLDQIEQMNSSGDWKGNFDLSGIAIAGHSYGANTSLTMVGQKYFIGGSDRSFADPRIKCAIYLSAPANLHGHSASEVFGAIKVPGMLMTGTEDNSPIGETVAADRRVPYDGISAPHQYLITFIGGNHMLFNGALRGVPKPGDEQMLREIEKLTTAFLDTYLSGDRKQGSWLDTSAASAIAADAKFERK